ncbi:MAG: uncharacterized protein KVP18_003707 [Porospora cf. gigantea A]|uniref:uncharacterized protein n=1 Tax=Porospora cf. gigantea A TaxID=2853593 RepID=UPI003559AD1E|nr:MAG: hypothetical protein KVP18_003707 [Porospora cf. gigantea A]
MEVVVGAKTRLKDLIGEVHDHLGLDNTAIDPSALDKRVIVRARDSRSNSKAISVVEIACRDYYQDNKPRDLVCTDGSFARLVKTATVQGLDATGDGRRLRPSVYVTLSFAKVA